MDFRSTNPAGFVHYGGDIMSGAQSTRGVLLSSNTVQAVSDNSTESLDVLAKGTGSVNVGNSSQSVFISGSTTPWKVVAGESTVTAPDLAANTQGECTLAAANISTGDIILQVDFRNTLSTLYLPGLPYVGAAGKIHVPVGNVHASTISASTGVTVRWLYLDRT